MNHKEERQSDNASFDILIKMTGGTLLLLLGIIGWNLKATYDLNAVVATHTVLLTNLKDQGEQIQKQGEETSKEVQAIYLSRQWSSVASSSFINNNQALK